MEPVSPDQLASWVREARRRWHVPGMAVAVRGPDSLVTSADGVYELAGDRPVSPETVFRVASITKPFVATLAMTLVRDGLLALDEPPPGSRARATVRQLLGNVGGLASDWPGRPDFGDDEHALARLAAAEPPLLPFEPGELFSYANAGFWLVGAAVAAATGTTFEAAMHARVLEPLGLAATGFRAASPARGHEQVHPQADEHRPVDDAYPRARRPSGGLWSTVGDLIRFAEHHLGGPGPLDAQSRAEMQAPVASGHGFDYGLGWFLTRRGGRRSVEHTGSAFGYQSRLLFLPDDGIAVASLTNSSRGAAAIDDVLRALGLAADEPPPHELAPEQLAAFAGRYRGVSYELDVSPGDDGLRLTQTSIDPRTGETERHPPLHARPIGEREFAIDDEGERRGERFDFPRDGVVRMHAVALRAE